MEKEFFEELKELCEKHHLYAGVYTRDAEGKSNDHGLYLIAGEEQSDVVHVALIFETIAYFVNLALKVAKDKMFVISELLKILSSIIREEGKEKDDAGNRTD